MAAQVFINLPVKDLNKSIEFFTKLGYSFNPQFTDENATCMIVSENSIYVMLLVEPFFKSFTKKEICDSSKAIEVMNSFSVNSKAEVDEMLSKALAAGATEGNTQDMGWMYNRSFNDINGHHWEFFYMDMSAMPQG